MAVSVIQILRAVSGGQGCFRTLSDIELLCISGSDTPIYNVGNSAVLFRSEIGGELCSVKCYTSSSVHRAVVYGDRLRPRELYVPLERERGEWIDVVVEKWIEGETLMSRIEKLVADDNREALSELSLEFDRLALENLLSPTAHGDITCENIIVDGSGELHLIDFDATFVPALAGAKSVELGTEAYQHPLRDEAYFDRSIDDYSLALISTALSALALTPSLYLGLNAVDGLLFDPHEILKGQSEALTIVMALFSRRGYPAAYVIAKMLYTQLPAIPNLETIMRLKVEGKNSSLEPCFVFSRDGMFGFLDHDEVEEVIPPLFDNALSFKENYAAVKLGDFWHYINSQAQVVVNCSDYQQLKSVKDGSGRGLLIGSSEWISIEM